MVHVSWQFETQRLHRHDHVQDPGCMLASTLSSSSRPCRGCRGLSEESSTCEVWGPFYHLVSSSAVGKNLEDRERCTRHLIDDFSL